MNNKLPKKVPNTNPFYAAWNSFIDWANMNTLKSSSDILVNQSQHGTSLTLVKQPVARPTNLNGLIPRGVYITGNLYQVNELVVLTGGSSAGSYYSIIGNNANLPNTGIGWIQLSYGGTNNLGSWS
jgi:hypothetical protein